MNSDNLLPKSLGGAHEVELNAAAASAAEAASDSDPARWDAAWHTTFSLWQRDASVNGPVALLFPDNPAVLGDEHDCEKHFQLGCRETRPTAGVYIVGRSQPSNGWRLPGSVSDHQANCKLIEAAKLGRIPTVIVGLVSDAIVYLPNGVSDAAHEGIRLRPDRQGSPFDDAVLTATLQQFADENLNSQELRKRVWEDSAKYLPIEAAERQIQEFLLIALRTEFGRKYSCLAETNLAVGRMDILIMGPAKLDPGAAVLELKVVRQFHSTGTAVNQTAEQQRVLDGAVQAKAYAISVSASVVYLCAYDMRKDQAPQLMTDLDSACAPHDVLFRGYAVYASSSQVQAAVVASARKHK